MAEEPILLLVDDDPDILEMGTSILNSAGFRKVREATNGVEALSRLKGVDLVLTDLQMPGMGGISLLREIRASRVHNRLPVIAITGNGDMDDVRRLIQNGITDYIVKPFEPELLVEKVLRALK